MLEGSAVVDFSQNVNGKPQYDSDLIVYGKNTSGAIHNRGIVWDADIGPWITHSIYGTSDGTSGLCGYNHHYPQRVRGDFYYMLDDIGSYPAKFYLFDRFSQNIAHYEEAYYIPGLTRGNLCFEDQETEYYGRFDIYNIDSGAKIKYMMTGFTLPINTVLFYGADGTKQYNYEWQSSNGTWNGKDATAAVKLVTQEACEKLKKNNNLRMYLVKYRKQKKYKHPVTQAETNFDYAYLDSCATDSSEPYLYENVADEAGLKSALDAIYTNIKNWAGRTEARNVNV